MLRDLHIRNVAIIDELTLEFDQGLNLLTGETGAGKSIIIDSLGLALGNRGSSDLIKTGAGEASVQALFSNVSSEELEAIAEEAGLNLSGEIVCRRRLTKSGTSRAYVNDTQVNLDTLRRIGRILVTVHGQGEGDELLTADGQLSLLDSYADVDAERASVAEVYDRLVAVEREVEKTSMDERTRARELDLLTHQINEIESARLDSEEEGELRKQRKLLLSAERIKQLGHGAYEKLYDSEESIISGLSEIEEAFSELKQFASRFDEMWKGVESIRFQLQEMASETRDFISSVEDDPDKLEQTEIRLDAYKSLQRKYGSTTEEVLRFLIESKTRAESLEHADQKLEELKKLQQDLDREYGKKAEALSVKRKSSVSGFEKKVESHLRELAMEKATFVVEVANHPRGKTRSGIDQVLFKISPNPGESPKPLAKIASGGEQSRLMLAIKSTNVVPRDDGSVIFDEVDSGIGGRVAEFVGRKLLKLSKAQQVICITHLPQIATYADFHATVTKKTATAATSVSWKMLDEDERIAELARMLGGEKITDVTRNHAQQMLEQARRYAAE